MPVEPEYCLFFCYDTWWLCMTKGDWAEWVSGIGAMLAVAGAAWIAVYQRSRQIKDAADVKKARAMRVAAIAHPILVDLYARLKPIPDGLKANAGRDISDAAYAALQLPDLHELSALGESLEALPPEICRAILGTVSWTRNARGLIAHSIVRVVTLESNWALKESAKSEGFIVTVEDLVRVCKFARDSVHEVLHGQKWEEQPEYVADPD